MALKHLITWTEDNSDVDNIHNSEIYHIVFKEDKSYTGKENTHKFSFLQSTKSLYY